MPIISCEPAITTCSMPASSFNPPAPFFLPKETHHLKSGRVDGSSVNSKPTIGIFWEIYLLPETSHKTQPTQTYNCNPSIKPIHKTGTKNHPVTQQKRRVLCDVWDFQPTALGCWSQRFREELRGRMKRRGGMSCLGFVVFGWCHW